MLMIIALLIQGIIAAPAATINLEPKSGVIVQTVCNDASDTHSNFIEFYDSNHNMLNNKLDWCNNHKGVGPCEIDQDPNTIFFDEDKSKPWIEHGGLIFGDCDWQGLGMTVWWNLGGGKRDSKTMYASCVSVPFDCALDPSNPTMGTKKEVRLY